MKNKILLVLLFAAGAIAFAGCGPGANSPATADAPATAAPATATPVSTQPVRSVGSACMSVSLYAFFGNPQPPAQTGTAVTQGSLKQKGKKAGGTHITRFADQSIMKSDSSTSGGCIGKGICDASPIAFTNYTLVTFTINANNPGVLLMTFSMSALNNNQPDQGKMFASNQPYMFDGYFDLAQLFSSDLLPDGAQITPQSTSTLTLGQDGDTMTDAITYYFIPGGTTSVPSTTVQSVTPTNAKSKK